MVNRAMVLILLMVQKSRLAPVHPENIPEHPSVYGIYYKLVKNFFHQRQCIRHYILYLGSLRT